MSGLPSPWKDGPKELQRGFLPLVVKTGFVPNENIANWVTWSTPVWGGFSLSPQEHFDSLKTGSVPPCLDSHSLLPSQRCIKMLFRTPV